MFIRKTLVYFEIHQLRKIMNNPRVEGSVGEGGNGEVKAETHLLN